MLQFTQEGWVGGGDDGVPESVLGTQLGVVFLTGDMILGVGVGNGSSRVVFVVGRFIAWFALFIIGGSGIASEFTERFLAED